MIHEVSLIASHRSFDEIWQDFFLKGDEVLPDVRLAHRSKGKREDDIFAGFDEKGQSFWLNGLTNFGVVNKGTY